jgi:hypothetical protein
MANFFKFAIFFCFICGVLACTEEPNGTEPINLDTNFFPLASGNYRDYSVTETIYFTSSDIETRVYQIREELGLEFENMQGAKSFELKRYSRIGSNDQWRLDSLWISRIDTNPAFRAVQVENNLSFIKLVFPIIIGKTWDGNALNNRLSERYEITEIFDTYSPSVNSLSFANCAMVLHQEDDDELTIRDIRYEVYSEDIGMVHRYNETLKYCSRPECLGQKIVESGRSIEMRLIGYGEL